MKAAALLVAALAIGPGASAQEITVYAAGSLRAALSEIARDHEAAGGAKVRLVFGASGLLRDRLRQGERADLFASANMEHPRSLADEGRAEGLRVFARNALCALAAPGLGLDPQNLVRRLLDPAVKVGTSTPKADPSGDYAFEMFERIESSGAAPAGSAAALKAKALQLTGGPNSPPPPPDRNVYGVLVAEGSADVFITYCTNAAIARQEQPRLQVVAVPESINVAASYGMVVLKPASAPATAFAERLGGPDGQRRLAAYGFSPP